MSDVVFIVIPVIKTDKDLASQTRLNWQLMLSVLGGVYMIMARLSLRGEMKSCTVFT